MRIETIKQIIAGGALAACAAVMGVGTSYGAAVSQDAAPIARNVAEADARHIASVIRGLAPLVTVAEYERAFGDGRVVYDLGGDEYRNMQWSFTMRSIDVPMTLHVGFNYGNASEWSATLDFGARSDDERLYFAALCRGFEAAAGRASRVARFEHDPAPSARFAREGKIITYRAHYPVDGSVWAELSSSDGPKGSVITILPASAADADDAEVVVTAAEANLREWPERIAPVKRVRFAGHRMTMIEREVERAKKKGDHDITWLRVCDADGMIAWVRSDDVRITGVTDVLDALGK